MQRLAVGAAALLALSACVERSGSDQGFWENRASLAIARDGHGAAAMDDRAWVAGGLTTDGDVTDTVERYDPENDTWSPAARLPLALHDHGMAAADGRIFVFGGQRGDASVSDRGYAYDPVTDRWTRIADMPSARTGVVAVAVQDRIYVLGGVSAGGFPVTDVTEYDPQTDRWQLRHPMPRTRVAFAAGELDGLLYVAGGHDGARAVDWLECYDPTTDSWTDLAPMPTARERTGAAALDGRLAVCGGLDDGGTDLDVTEAYDPNTEDWVELAAMSDARHDVEPVRLDGEVLIAGGAVGPESRPTASTLALRDLPSGIGRFGVSTPACLGPIRMVPNGRPTAGNRGFELRIGPRAPASTPGVLLIGTVPDRPGSLVVGFRLHIRLVQPVIVLAVESQPTGEARMPVPIPTGTTGAHLFAQLVWLNTPSCPGSGPLSSSDALAITVQ